ncbi:MAG: fused MFS/spermidine synthase [Polyangiaceae bacterium]|nr:fused MFS/spermidine synthase [Polyangiaceae bacterium]
MKLLFGEFCKLVCLAVAAVFVLLGSTRPALADPQSPQTQSPQSPASALPCGTENLLASKSPSRSQIVGDAALVTDGEIVEDGALWDGPAAAELGPAGSLTYDLGAPREVRALYLQADANDTYRILGSLDDSSEGYREIGVAADVAARGHGLRARAMEIAPVSVRFLRVVVDGGDGAYSISEFAAYCQTPSPFPPPMRQVEAPMASVQTEAIKALPALPEPPTTSPVGWFEIGLVALLALLLGAWLRERRVRPDPEGNADVKAEAFFPLVLVLFMASGCAALIYEIVWFQLLELVIGSSAMSIAVLLGTYMGGMFVGSLAIARLAKRRIRVHPLWIYAMLELGIGLCGLLMLPAMPLVQHVYTAVVGHGVPGLLLRGLFAALCLLPPTIMMGATLPAAARWVESTPRGISWMGYFYGANTLGAVVGCLLAGFFLLRVFDMPTATYVAVSLNAFVAVCAFGITRWAPRFRGDSEQAAAPAATEPARAARARNVYLTIALSGMSALGAEVLWTRQFWLLLGGTTYTFSIILAVFLVGIGLGSAVGSSIARRTSEPNRALGSAQLLLILAIAWTVWNLSHALPFWPVDPAISPSTWYQFQIDFVRCAWAVLPAACLWGASFPLALAAATSEGDDTSVVVGRVYAANTVGAIVGSLGTSLLIIPLLGTLTGERILLVIAALAAVSAFYPSLYQERSMYRARAVLPMVAALGIAGSFVRSVAPIPPMLVAHGRATAAAYHSGETFLYVGEGMNSTLAISRDPNGIMSYHNAGKVQASTQPQDMRLQRMLGHLTTLVPENPRSVLVVACGAGVTAGAVSIDPRLDRVTLVEIEPLVPQAASKYFGEYNHHVVTNPKVKVEIDDARHYLNTTRETFDAITSDPFDPWVKGAATLYTTEFWELAKQHLKPGGVVTVFVQLYQSGTRAVKSEVATFFKVFPQGVIFGNTVHGEGYDVVLLGQRDPKPIDVDRMTDLLARPEFSAVRRSLRQTGFNSAVALLSTYGSRGPDLKEWLADAQINHDRDLRLQFLAGFDLNANEAQQIYRGILPFRKYPEDFFVGSAKRLNALRTAMQRRPP